MSILIPGMKMPKKCSTCPFVEDDFLEDYFSPYCPLTGERPYGNERLNSCPLIELPLHGRLIDADAFLAKLKKDPLFPLVENYGMSGVIEAQPTIIPAAPGGGADG